MTYAPYLAIGLLCLYFVTKYIRKCRLRRNNLVQYGEFKSGGKQVSDGFYCLLLKDGSSRGDFVDGVGESEGGSPAD